MRAVVVVAEENQAGDEIQFSENAVVIAQSLDPPRIAFRAFGNAGAPSVLGDDDRLVGERLMDLLQTAPQIVGGARSPALEVFVAFDEIHQAANVLTRRLL